MKKLLRKLIILIVIVCIYLLIKKNTTRLGLPTQIGTIQTWVVATWIDLTNCVSYFDGCNNCSVKDGKADACTLMYCEKPSEPKCLQEKTGENIVSAIEDFSFQIPKWRTITKTTSNPCADYDCSIPVLRIATNIKDNSWYVVYALLKIDEVSKNKVQATDKILINQPDKKLVQLEWVSWFGSFMLDIKGKYYLIEIADFTSEQPKPAGYNDLRQPYNVTEKDINNLITIIKSISK